MQRKARPIARSDPATAHVHAIGTAVPANDVHAAFVAWAERALDDSRARALLARMAARSGIAHRWSVLDGDDLTEPGRFYCGNAMPGTAARMAVYAQEAPRLALAAVADLAGQTDLDGVTHLVVASCTGFVAPGVDQIIARALGLAPTVERLLVGYMGCYAAVAALRSARHIVRSTPDARVLVICVELSTLHLQGGASLESLLAQMQFGDGAGAALVSAAPGGLAIDAPFAMTLPDTPSLIRWDIGDQGFAMHLSGRVPATIAGALSDPAVRDALLPVGAGTVGDWAVHAGGRSILDAVEQGLALAPDALDDSRQVLHDNGNMSSATLLFVLRRKLARRAADRQGLALAFGPGVAAEGFLFRAAA
jgi:predicted naringenin-chalcone synthase